MVSSAYNVNLCSVSLIVMPLVFSLCLIFVARISAQTRKIQLEIGSPCLQPRSRLKKEERNPACVTAEIELL